MTTLGGRAFAQSDIEANAGTEFNFSSPGARSLGMGGAFVGLADDATAALANPAGLTTLTAPEVSLEGRSWGYTTFFTDQGALDTPSNIGVDRVEGIVEGESKSSQGSLSFASFVYPKGRFALAAYYATNARFKTDFSTNGAFTLDDHRLFPTSNLLELDVKSFGLALAFQMGKSLSIGLGAANYDCSLHSTTQRFSFTSLDTSRAGQPGSIYGPPDFGSGNVINQQTQDGEAKKWVFNAGLILKMGEKMRLGASYRQGPKFDFDLVHRGGTRFNNTTTIFKEETGSFHIPDTLGAGLVYRPSDSATLALEYRRVAYSQLVEDFVIVFNTEAPFAAAEDFVIDDANEIHGGFEYVLSKMKNPLAIRLGGWYDPQHRIHYEGPSSVNSGSYVALFRKASNSVHGTAGLGIVMGRRMQVDAAVDVSSRSTTASASAVVRF
jgi:long-subunit fatty acid transport protein